MKYYVKSSWKGQKLEYEIFDSTADSASNPVALTENGSIADKIVAYLNWLELEKD